MTDDQLDQHLRAWYRAEIGDVGPAPPSLYASVAGIPDATPAPIGSRRSWILLAAAAMLLTLLIGAAVAIGSGLLRPPWVVDHQPPLDADGSGVPSASAAASAEPSASAPLADACRDMGDLAAELGAVSGRGWPGPASSAGSPTEARPGLIAGWGWDGDVVLFDPLTGSETPILPLYPRGLAWSPDGRALAVAACELWIVVGNDAYRPAPGLQIASLEWSPDSTSLAVVSWGVRGAEESLSLVPQDGGPIVDLRTPCTRCRFDRALWSPDGSRLAVHYIVDVPNPDVDPPKEWGLAFADPNGGGWRLQPMQPLWIGTVSGWLDDRHLLAAGTRDEVSGWFSISVDDPDDVRSVDDPGDYIPSPDGSNLALVSWTQADEAYDPNAVDYEVTVVDVASGERRVIWSDKSESVNALWAPDSATLAITTQSESIFNRGVWIVNADGSEPRHVRDQPFELMDWQPLWP